MAQLVEQLIRNQQVVGSSPIPSSNRKRMPLGILFLFKVENDLNPSNFAFAKLDMFAL